MGRNIAAYLSAKENKRAGKPTLLALTNDHVCFYKDKRDGEGNNLRPPGHALNSISSIERSRANMPRICTIWPRRQLRIMKLQRKAWLMVIRKPWLNMRGKDLCLPKPRPPSHPTAINAKKKTAEAASALSQFRGAKKTLGTVYGTGGSRVDPRSGMPMAWGDIKAPDNELLKVAEASLTRQFKSRFPNQVHTSI